MSPAKRNKPVRTCAGCGMKASKSELVRLVVRGGRFCVDERGIMSGRGTYAHSGEECVARIKKNRRFSQFFAQTTDGGCAAHALIKCENQGVE